MKLFLLILLLAFPLISRADQPRYNEVFTSKNGKFQLKYQSDERLIRDGEWILQEMESGKEIYRLTGNYLQSMTVLVSDDGKSVAAIDDYSTQNYENNPEILIFYKNGKKLKSYKLDEIYNKHKFLIVSTSHFRWTFEYEKTFSIKDSKLNLTTYDLNNYIFNVESGRILKKERDKILSGDAVYVFGEIEPLGEDKYAIQAGCVIYGKAEKESRIVFESKKIGWQGGGLSEALIIKDGKLLERKDVFLTYCN